MNSFFTKQLLHWHQYENQRLPIGVGETDPYKVWVREIILQQTRVDQATDYYRNLLKNFPSVKVLADASEEKIFKVWEGLGYYSRCSNMIKTAKYIAYECGENFPTTYEKWIALKGVGEYTAAAMMSFCYNQPYAVVDGNVNRILARYFGIYTDILSTQGKKEMLLLAQQLLSKKQSALYNQAIMDFGATVCTPKNALCKFCVMKKKCFAFNNNVVETLPIKKKKAALEHIHFVFFVVKYQSLFALQKRTANDIWKGLYIFPNLEIENNLSEKKIVSLVLKNYPSLQIKFISNLYQQTLTHKKITAHFIVANTPTIIEKENWEYVADFSDYFFPKIINDFLENEKKILIS